VLWLCACLLAERCPFRGGGKEARASHEPELRRERVQRSYVSVPEPRGDVTPRRLNYNQKQM
jgi:hypothetical protein